MTDQTQARHSWRFFRAGGFDQALFESGADLLALPQLDQKLWMALSCPVSGVEFDQRTLQLIDRDNDGHIRAPEIIAAIEWTALRLAESELLLEGREELPLTAIRGDTEEGRRILASAKSILVNLGQEGAEAISIAAATDSVKIFEGTRFNGDGVITVSSSDDAGLREWVAAIGDTLGTVLDRSGEAGINLEQLEAFSAGAAAWLDWQEGGEAVSPLDAAGREEACRLWDELKEKLDDFFIRCRLAGYDSRAASALSGTEEGLLALSPQNLAARLETVAALPLAMVNPEQILQLDRGVNPAWSARIARLRQLLIAPLLGPQETLSGDDWERLKGAVAPLEAWWSARVETPAAQLGGERLRQWREEQVEGALRALIEADLALAAEAEAVVEVEMLTRYCRDLFPLVNNYVAFRHFYTGRSKAIFQCGTLYLDGRSCELCVPVRDVGRHAMLAGLSRLFLVYCDCSRSGGSERMTIAAAITSGGDTDQIMVGRNGVFYDRQGLDWDATVVRIIDNPISMRQSFWSPYKRISRMIGEQINKMAAARSKAVEEKAAGTALQAAKVDEKAPPPQPFDVAKFAGIFAAIGLALGAIGTAVAAVVTGLLSLAWWQMPLAILGVMLLISGPAMVIDWFKLRRRNLGPLLDANGWAINARARLNIPFGTSLTGIARLPAGSRQLLKDPFAEKKHGWKIWSLLLFLLVLFLVFAWHDGWIGVWLQR